MNSQLYVSPSFYLYRSTLLHDAARCCTMQRADDKLCVRYVVFQCIRNIWVFNGLLSSPPLMFVPLSSIIVYHKDITTLPNRNILGQATNRQHVTLSATTRSEK